MNEVLRVGDLLDGYCGGKFELGPDQVRVEALGADWVVVRTTTTEAIPQFYAGRPEDLLPWRGKSWGERT